MKNFLYFLVVFFALAISSGCTKDPCKDVSCNSHGTCASGLCSCSTGYEGTNCETESRERFIGNWTGPISFTGPLAGSGTTTIAISKGSAIDGIVVNNLFTCSSISLPLNATVKGSNVQSIAGTACSGINLTFSTVSWSASGNSMSFSFAYSVEGVGTGTVSGSFTK